MSIAENLLPEFDQEMANTRRLLAVVPAADAGWRPHPKSYTLGDLAAHIATIPVWCRYTLQQDELDLGSPDTATIPRVKFATGAELLEQFDRHVQEARASLAAASDGDMGKPWTLRNGATAVFSLPRAAVLRGFVLSHMIHHRGQLTVYLRLRDVPLPAIYGRTADSG
ncbi:MAG TPA: DinB family protein [Gemmatimonadales bacterium]